MAFFWLFFWLISIETVEQTHFCSILFNYFTSEILDYLLEMIGLKKIVVMTLLEGTLMNDLQLAGIGCVTRFIVIAH